MAMLEISKIQQVTRWNIATAIFLINIIIHFPPLASSTASQSHKLNDYKNINFLPWIPIVSNCHETMKTIVHFSHKKTEKCDDEFHTGAISASATFKCC